MARRRWMFLFLILSGLVIYGRALTIGYLSDDFDLLTAATSPLYSLLDPFPAGRGTYFRPLVMASLMATESLAETGLLPGVPVFWHHLVNLLLHLANGSLLLLLLRGMTGKQDLSFVLSLLFLLHPANVANVYWISGRTDLLVAFFFLLTLLGLAFYARRGNRAGILLAGASVVGALLSKEMGATLPAVLLVMALLLRLETAYWPYAWSRGTAVLVGGAWLATLAYLAYLYFRFYAPAQGAGGLAVRPFHMLAGLLLTPALALWPNSEDQLAQLYRAYPWAWVVGLVAGLAFLLGVAWRWRRPLRKEAPRLALLASLLLVPLLPLLLFSQGVSSRLLYLPLALLALAAGWLFFPARTAGQGNRSRWPALAVLLILITGAAGISWRRGDYWQANWSVIQAHCRSFQALLGNTSADPQLLFLSAPNHLRQVPLFSNDLNGTLYHCYYGTFDKFSQMIVLGSVVTVSPATMPGQVVVLPEDNGRGTTGRPCVGSSCTQGGEEGQEVRTYRVTVVGSDSYFIVSDDTRPGQVYTLPGMEIKVEAMRHTGQLTAFTVSLAAETAVSRHIFYSDGRSFKLLKPD